MRLHQNLNPVPPRPSLTCRGPEFVHKAIHLSLWLPMIPTAASTRPAWLVCAEPGPGIICGAAPRSGWFQHLVSPAPGGAARPRVAGAGAADQPDQVLFDWSARDSPAATGTEPCWRVTNAGRWYSASVPADHAATGLATSWRWRGERAAWHQLAAGLDRRRW